MVNPSRLYQAMCLNCSYMKRPHLKLSRLNSLECTLVHFKYLQFKYRWCFPIKSCYRLRETLAMKASGHPQLSAKGSANQSEQFLSSSKGQDVKQTNFVHLKYLKYGKSCNKNTAQKANKIIPLSHPGKPNMFNFDNYITFANKQRSQFCISCSISTGRVLCPVTPTLLAAEEQHRYVLTFIPWSPHLFK